MLPKKPEGEIRTGRISPAGPTGTLTSSFAEEILASDPLKGHMRQGAIRQAFVFVDLQYPLQARVERFEDLLCQI